MSFLKSIDNTITYPYNTRTDHPNTSFPSGSDYPSFNVYWVYPTPADAGNPDPAEYNPVEIEPVFNPSSGRWEQAWDYVAKTDEEKRLAKYNPSSFLQGMFDNAEFENWLSQFSTFKQAGFLDAATNAKVDNNWSVVQTLYDTMAGAIAPTPSFVAEWQALADANGIPLTF